MKTASMWIIRAALVVQFIGVLAVPVIVSAAESPRATWMAEWMNPSRSAEVSSPVASSSEGRTIGVLTLRDGKLWFREQRGQASFELDLADVKRVATANGGKALSIETMAGEQYLVAIMDATLMQSSPKRVVTTLERALDALSASSK